jgi:hypothetical protein
VINGVISGTGNKITINESSSFDKCTSEGTGGAILIKISRDGELNGISMSECEGTEGGAIHCTITGSGKLSILNECTFTSCCSTSGNGGAIYALLSTATTRGIYIIGTSDDLKTSFLSCTASNSGGAIFISIAELATSQFTITGPAEFNDCTST